MLKASKIKNIISLISALIILYNSSGVLLSQPLIQFTKFFNHTSIVEKDTDEEIILLAFDKSKKIGFEKSDIELRYNGSLYDINPNHYEFENNFLNSFYTSNYPEISPLPPINKF